MVKKFTYDRIIRDESDGTRKYLTPDGNKVPSVTTILSATKSQESKEILQQWRNKVGNKVAQEITSKAANRGTRMHSYLENYIIDGYLKEAGSNPYSKISHNMASSIINNGMKDVSEVYGVEIPLYYPELYAGTTDCIGIHNNIESIIDYKQSNKPKKREWIDDYFIQLTAYALAHNKIHGTNIKRGVIMMAIHQEDFKIEAPYLEFILEGDEFEKYENLWWDRVEQFYGL